MFVLIIDYGSGNIKSVYNSVKKTIHNFNKFSEVKVSRNLSEIEKADKIILPGVGSFDQCMNRIRKIKDLEEIKRWLHSGGTKANTHGLRLTTHPGQFNVLTSPHEHVVENCVTDLTIHGEVFDMMGLSRTPYNKINIHVGGVYGDKQSALDRFCKNFERLPDSVKTRLTVENDDKATCYSVEDLYHGVYRRIGLPIVFDYHHHRFCPGDLTEQAAVELAASTWPEGIKPCFHYSESRSEEKGDPKIKPQAHSDYVYQYIDTYGYDVDIVVEAKHKELAVEKYYQIHGR